MLDYEFYKSEYGGKVSEEDFPKLKIQAKSIIDYYSFSRAKETNRKVKMAMCELIEHISTLEEIDGKEIASEKVGSYSVTYALNNDSGYYSIKRKQKEIVFRHLGHTGLLYRGM